MLALLDSASLYFRAFYALPDSMAAADGTPVNAVRGFTDTLARIVTERRPSRLVCCLDADWRPQFRTDLLPSYKAHRVAEESEAGPDVEEVPDTLTPQVPIILDLLDAFGFATAEAAALSDVELPLTPAELAQLRDELHEVVLRYKRERRPGDEAVVVQLQAFPRRRP